MPETLLAPAPEESLTANQSAFYTLRNDIISGKLPPGTRLVHRTLAKQLGISTIPVIDALRQLEGIGLLVSKPGVGAEVRRWKPQEYEEAFLIRAAHEGVACRLFAERATPEDVDVLEKQSRDFDAAVREGEFQKYSERDAQLHMHIVCATQSRNLIRLVENSGLILMTLRNTLLPAGFEIANPDRLIGIHDPLVEALQSRDAERAEFAGRQHVLDAYEGLRKLVADYLRFHPDAGSTPGGNEAP